jgi:hypothetical protein
MTRLKKTAAVWVGHAVVVALLAAMALAQTPPTVAESPQLNTLLPLVQKKTAALLNEISDVKCTEKVRQEKLGKNGKVRKAEDAVYDYLVILSNSEGDLSLSESRIPVRKPKKNRKNSSMLLSNGFATLFVVFHPYYSEDFTYSLAGKEVLQGRSLAKIHFQHIPGTKSPAALALRGREYPLELRGTAWVDPMNGSIAKIQAGIADTLQDVGLRSMESQIEFAPLSLDGTKQVYWLPTRAGIEVQTPRQHWRNLHQFTTYKKFTVSTEEQVISQ